MNSDELLKLARLYFTDKEFSAITYESGPYDITNPTLGLKRFAATIFEMGYATANTEIENLHERIRELEAENARLKTVPMKYRRMEFNAQLQKENDRLYTQVASEREVSDKLEKALRELSLYVAYNGDDWVKRQATAALAEVSNLRANIARIRKQT